MTNTKWIASPCAKRASVYVFDDDRIWHMLTPVAVLEGNQYAYRDTLAFDMLPEGWEPVK